MRWAGRLLVVLVLVGGVVLLVRMRQEPPAPVGEEPPAAQVAKAEQPPAPKPAEVAKPVVPPSAAPPVPKTSVPEPIGIVPPLTTVGVSIPVPPPASLELAPASPLPAIPSVPTTVVPASVSIPAVPAAEPKLPPLPMTTPATPPGLPAVPPPADLAPKVAVPPAPVSNLKPLASAPDKATVVYLNQPRVAVEYEVTKKGPSGLGTVELWVKDANGWSKAAAVKSGEALEADLPADGAYGAKVVPVSGQGVRGAEPAKDAEPDLWVVRDTAPPQAVLKVQPASWREGEPPVMPFMVELTAKDANLACDTLVVEWGEGDKPPSMPLFTAKDLGNQKIETKLGVFQVGSHPAEKGEKKADGVSVSLTWKPAAGVPARVSFRVSVKDRAGNVGTAVQPNIGTDLTAPAAKVVNVHGLPRLPQ